MSTNKGIKEYLKYDSGHILKIYYRSIISAI
jgi:hypothetical protein